MRIDRVEGGRHAPTGCSLARYKQTCSLISQQYSTNIQVVIIFMIQFVPKI